MKSRLIVIACILAVSTSLLLAEEYSNKECMKMLTGTWSNEKYTNAAKSDIWINNPDATYETYREKTDESPWVT